MLRRAFLQFLGFAAATVPPSPPPPLPPPPAPPPRVPLVEAFVAGFRFHAGLEVAGRIRAGHPLTLVRDPGNRFDPNAIRLLWEGRQIGFVPRTENAAAARLLDHGRVLEALVVAVNHRAAPWERVRFRLELVG